MGRGGRESRVQGLGSRVKRVCFDLLLTGVSDTKVEPHPVPRVVGVRPDLYIVLGLLDHLVHIGEVPALETRVEDEPPGRRGGGGGGGGGSP